jgi:hypothetical protein
MLPNEMTRDEFERELDNLGVTNNEEYSLASVSFPTKMVAIEWSLEQKEAIKIIEDEIFMST